MSASGFLVATALAEALRKPYHQGDFNVTMQYLVEGLPIGEYRVLLKRNFDTACWVPPTGKRGSHTIYYGDRMLERVIEFFNEKHELGMPTSAEIVEKFKAEQKAAADEAVARGRKPKLVPLSNTIVLERKIQWLKDSVAPSVWVELQEMVVKAVASYGAHERQHARHTTQDLKMVNADLKALGIQFTYFNLFEDARIEHLYREDLNAMFDWVEFEALASMKTPISLFLRCIQLEGAPDQAALDSEDDFADEEGRTIGHVADSVQSYYQRACQCTTSEQLYPIIKEFLEEFKEDLPPPPEDGEAGGGAGSGSGGGGASGMPAEGESASGEGAAGEGGDPGEETSAGERATDLSVAAEAAEKGDEFFDEFEADADVVGGTDSEGKAAEEEAKQKLKGTGPVTPPNNGSKGQGTPCSITPESSGGRARESAFLTQVPGTIDATYAKRVEHLTSMLMRMFKSHTLPAATENPGHRMSSRHLAHGELRFIHKKVFGGKGKRKYSIVYDCSGSMQGAPDREGKLLLLALNNLARRGFLEGHLILSGYVDGRPSWLQYKMPVAESIIMRIQPSHCSEGLQTALEDNLKHIKGMDDVFVYTDANICDSPLNRAQFARSRIWPVGLYVGSASNATEMEEHFPQNIIKDTIEQVVETMLTRNRRTVG